MPVGSGAQAHGDAMRSASAPPMADPWQVPCILPVNRACSVYSPRHDPKPVLKYAARSGLAQAQPADIYGPLSTNPSGRSISSLQLLQMP
ncbi:hypothetical protein L13192_02984 [Pyrenophora tritici-repentis]|uniref:Uncharacterized protein n=1 Tax=Pyrenophora tritici-repentis TaxID=45151 RepID=A0A922T249_9PLEO|nr:hypothetical protein Ptr86124_001688 [Pyrenophora tritici-repentis]KAI1672125.1 hypothetical protein L13192_02984 [Pyrenophora tritici-repentis]